MVFQCEGMSQGDLEEYVMVNCIHGEAGAGFAFFFFFFFFFPFYSCVYLQLYFLLHQSLWAVYGTAGARIPRKGCT